VRLVRVADDRDGQRIDNFLVGQLKGVPKSLIYRILRTGQVRVNGKRAKPDSRLAGGDEVRIPPVRVAEPGVVAPPSRGMTDRIGEAVIYEDRDFLVLSKPAGIAAHGGSGVSHGAIELLRALRPKDTIELVHRLDRDTSGVLVLARRRAALTGLQELIRENRTTKQYLCLLQGHLPRSSISVNAPLRKSILQGGERMVRVDDAGKPSLTHFKTIDRYAVASFVEATLETGRTHQIRVHSQHLGHPIAGDEKYGDADFNKTLRPFGLRRLFLHAKHFGFELGGRSYAFSAPLAEDLASVLDRLPRDANARR
jgi:23S rRNA pseudouridine955/2504/2580 synthase